jgi:hypothetical protein
MRNISDTTATWFVVLGLLAALALTSFLPAQGEARRDAQEPAVQRLSRTSSELSDAAANARVPSSRHVPADELWWTPSEQWNFVAPSAGPDDVLAQAEAPLKRVAGEPHRTWFCSLFRLRSPAT